MWMKALGKGLFDSQKGKCVFLCICLHVNFGKEANMSVVTSGKTKICLSVCLTDICLSISLIFYVSVIEKQI